MQLQTSRTSSPNEQPSWIRRWIMREAACAAKEAELAAALARQAAIGESVKRGGDEAVSLSIGGTLFTVTRGALTSTDDSFFTAQERSIRWTHR